MTGESDVIDVDEYLRIVGGKTKRSKYNNHKVFAEDRWFDSEAEYRHYRDVLKIRLAACEIYNFEFQPEFELIPGYRRKSDGKKIQPIKYRADFAFVEASDGIRTVIDVKGTLTKEFVLKRKILEWRYPDLRFELVEVNNGHRTRTRRKR